MSQISGSTAAVLEYSFKFLRFHIGLFFLPCREFRLIAFHIRSAPQALPIPSCFSHTVTLSSHCSSIY